MIKLIFMLNRIIVEVNTPETPHISFFSIHSLGRNFSIFFFNSSEIRKTKKKTHCEFKQKKVKL